MNRMQALTTGFGVTALMLIGVACGSGGGGPASPEPGAPVSPPPAPEQVTAGLSGDPSPPIPHGDPRPSLTYEGAVYYQEALSSAEAANLNEDGLELVGSTIDSNTLPPNSGESLKIYELKNGEAYQVYTLTPGRGLQNEDGSTTTIKPEWTRWSAPPAQEQVTAGLSEAAPGDTAPPIPHGTPLLNLTYEGAVYYRTALSTDEAANLNENDLELVGTSTESNLLLPAGSEIRRFIVDLNHDNPEITLSEIKDRVEAKFQIGVDKSVVGRVLQGGLNIYKLKDGEEGYVYTFEPGRSQVNPEDGQIIEFPAAWQRWTAADSNGT